MRRTKNREIFLMSLGSLFMAAGIYFFRMSNNFITGGAGGIAIVLSSLIPDVTKGSWLMGINILSIAAGLIFLGKSFSWKTIYCCAVYSVMVLLLESFYPMEHPFTDESFLELVIAVILCGIGSGFIFYVNASSGGIEVIAMILRKKTCLSVGNALLYVNLVIALAAAVLFDMEICILSVLGVLINSIVVDNVIQQLNTSKVLLIVTACQKELCEYIHCALNSGTTVLDCVGGYSGENKKILLVVLPSVKAGLLQRTMKQLDKNAFMVILNMFESKKKKM